MQTEPEEVNKLVYLYSCDHQDRQAKQQKQAPSMPPLCWKASMCNAVHHRWQEDQQHHANTAIQLPLHAVL